MVRVGVTGATGYIGGALLPALVAAGYEVRGVDDRSGPVTAERPELPIPNLDFASEEALRLLSECEVVLHLAAASGVMMCARDPVGTARVNVTGTARLLDRCRDRHTPVAFASSLAVVGSPEQLPVTERTPARPTHEYARQKAAGEQLFETAGRAGGIPTVVVRQSNVFGGYWVGPRYISKGNVIQLFAQQARGGTLTVNAPGTQRRDFIHLEDVVAHWLAVVRYLVRPGAAAGQVTVHAASGEALSVLEVAHRVAATYHRLYPDLSAPRVEVVPNPREGVELVEPEFSVSRAETERLLGLRCRQTVEGALPTILKENRGPDAPAIRSSPG